MNGGWCEGEEQAPAWFRESVQRAWRVGNRVRINIGECALHEEDRHGGDVPLLQGKTGHIITCQYACDLSHPFLVRLDTRIPSATLHGAYVWGVACAAHELDPLTDDEKSEKEQRS